VEFTWWADPLLWLVEPYPVRVDWTGLGVLSATFPTLTLPASVVGNAKILVVYAWHNPAEKLGVRLTTLRESGERVPSTNHRFLSNAD